MEMTSPGNQHCVIIVSREMFDTCEWRCLVSAHIAIGKPRGFAADSCKQTTLQSMRIFVCPSPIKQSSDEMISDGQLK